MGAARGVLIGAVVAGYALLSHVLMSRHPHAPVAIALLLGPMWAGLFGLVPRRHAAWGWPLVAVAGLVIGKWLTDALSSDVQRLYLLQHAAIHLALGLWFALWPRRDGLTPIGQMARRVHGRLTPAMAAYTRHVNTAWAAYGLGMAALSVLLFAAAPFPVWSLFANVATPLVAAMVFLGEHWLRYRLHPEFERASMADAIRAFRTRAAPSGESAAP